jgi:hypothetical protein
MVDERAREFFDWVRKNYMEPMLVDGLNDIRTRIAGLDERVTACEPPAGREAIAAKLMPAFIARLPEPEDGQCLSSAEIGMAAADAVRAADALLRVLLEKPLS